MAPVRGLEVTGRLGRVMEVGGRMRPETGSGLSARAGLPNGAGNKEEGGFFGSGEKTQSHSPRCTFLIMYLGRSLAST